MKNFIYFSLIPKTKYTSDNYHICISPELENLYKNQHFVNTQHYDKYDLSKINILNKIGKRLLNYQVTSELYEIFIKNFIEAYTKCINIIKKQVMLLKLELAKFNLKYYIFFQFLIKIFN